MLFAHESKPLATRRRYTFTVLLILIQSFIWIGTSHAQDRQILKQAVPIDFQIPAQALTSALTQFATQSKLFLVYQSEIAQDQRTSAVNGRYTPDQALGLLLRDTELGFRRTPDGTVTIKEGFPRPQLVAATDDSLAETRTQRQTADDAPVETLPEVLVPGFRLTRDSYSAPNATTATKLDTPIMETPLSIQVVPQQTLKDQQAIQLGDAIKNVSGVLQGNTQGGFSEEFIIRGFNTGFANYLDGFRFPSIRLSTALAERVEVLKGAAANLYGRIPPGGMINMVLKRPQATPYYSLQQQFGSFGQYRTTGDATGPLTKDQSLQYRFNFENLDSQSFRDFVFTDRVLFAPAIRWNVSEDTTIDLDYFYSDEKTVNDWTGIPAIGDRPADIPISRFLGEPSTDRDRTEINHFGVTVQHQLTDNWGMRGRFVYLRREVIDRITNAAGIANPLNETTGELSRQFVGFDSWDQVYFGTLDIKGKFTTGPMKHRVLIGWDIYDSTSEVPAIQRTAGSINIFNPVYGNSGVTLSEPQTQFVDFRNDWTGVYVQDQITLWDNLHILGGGRYDWATRGVGFVRGPGQTLAAATATRNDIKNERFSPRVGVLYQPWAWLSLFSNYSESLGNANSGASPNGGTLDPEVAKQYEAGFKTELFDQRFTSSVVFYHLTKQNLQVPIAGTVFSRAIGEARSQGVEIDLAGQITDTLSLIATYAYTDIEITKGQNKGNRLHNAAKHIGSVWARYDGLPKTPLEGLSVGAGIYLASEREGDTANTYQLPGYGRVDTLARYQFPFYATRMSVQLNVFNLLDKTYYESTIGDRFTITPGAPRTFLGSIRIEY
ncbi:MAG: ferrichrome-iron receptor [Nitrospirales bacterium]|nr:MAG: ferrichrome-iron receptor [Nitrospirales bacterium]